MQLKRILSKKSLYIAIIEIKEFDILHVDIFILRLRFNISLFIIKIKIKITLQII